MDFSGKTKNPDLVPRNPQNQFLPIHPEDHCINQHFGGPRIETNPCLTLETKMNPVLFCGVDFGLNRDHWISPLNKLHCTCPLKRSPLLEVPRRELEETVKGNQAKTKGHCQECPKYVDIAHRIEWITVKKPDRSWKTQATR